MGEEKGFPGREKIATYFEGLLEKHGDSYLALDWNKKENQELRFAVLMEIIGYTDRSRNFSILDVGCGLGHFYDFLKEKGLVEELGIKYHGIDISEKLIELAKKKNPEAKFDVVDLLKDKFDTKYDFVMESGIFNVKMTDEPEHKKHAYQMLLKMYALANVGVAATFASAQGRKFLDNNAPGAERYTYFAPEELIILGGQFTNRYTLRHDYFVLDFCMYLYK